MAADMRQAVGRRRTGAAALGAAALLWTVAAQAQAPGDDALRSAQGEANRRQEPRSVPARTIPTPSTVDAGTAALIAAPYSPFWDWNPPTNAAWRAMLAQSAAKSVPKLAAMRAKLGVTMTPTTLGGVKAFVLTPRTLPPAHRDQIVFQIHGGGYVFGAGESGTGEATLMAALGGYRVIAVDYRMPPDSPYPAAVDDLVAAWQAVAATTDPRRIAIEGTSTGGALTLELAMRIRDAGLPMPAALAPGSPWSDMTKTGDSYRTNEWTDNVLASYDGYLVHAALLYAHGHDLKDPRLSPVYGDFHGLPPAILTAGTRDLFLSNTVRTHRRFREAGIEADLQVFEGESHAQFAVDPDAGVTKAAFGEVARFFDAHLSNQAGDAGHR